MLRFLTSGESHGPQLTVILDGFPAGFKIDFNQINYQLARRQKGYGRGDRMKIEDDHVEIVSGIRDSVTLGSPVTFVIKNRDWANWEQRMHPEIADDKEKITRPRPGHADLAGAVKFHQHDMRNVLERASARDTAARVAAGAMARQLLEHFDMQLVSHVVQIGDVVIPDSVDREDLEVLAQRTEQSPVRCIDPGSEKKMIEAIDTAGAEGDTLGGVVEIITRGVPIGLGSYTQWDQRLDGRLAAAAMSIPSVKGVEIGWGFRAAGLPGTQTHDEIFYEAGRRNTTKGFYRKTNRAGGIEGGISNGEDIVLRLAVKPVSTLRKPLRSVDVVTKEPLRALVERADTCVVPAVAVVGEAVAALVLADAFLAKFGSDCRVEIEENYKACLNRPF